MSKKEVCMDGIIIAKTSQKGFKWEARRNGVIGYGKNKDHAISDLKETERFIRIANKD